MRIYHECVGNDILISLLLQQFCNNFHYLLISLWLNIQFECGLRVSCLVCGWIFDESIFTAADPEWI